MKKRKLEVKIIVLAFIDIVLMALLVWMILLTPSVYEFKNTNSLVAGSDTAPFEESQDSDSAIEEVTQIDYYANLTQKSQPSYLEMCELEYVASPAKRNRQQALETIRQLAPSFPAMWIVLENEALYSDELLKSLAANPEMTDYAYRYLTADGSITGGIQDYELPEEYPLFLQWDIRWGYYPYGVDTIGTSGCGPCCLSMAVYYLTGDKSATPNAIVDYSNAHNYYVQNVGTSWGLLDTYPTNFGLRVTRPSLSEANLKAELDKGNVLICSVRPGDFTYSGHFIVIYGYDENGFKVNDPKCVYRSRQSWTYEQIKDDIKKTWSIGK